jgi:hypothetical protein
MHTLVRMDPRADATVGGDDYLTSAVAELARAELAESGRRAVLPTVAAGMGLALAVAGLQLLAGLPIIPRPARRLRRQVGVAGVGYLAAGGVLAVFGLLGVRFMTA